MYDLFLNQDIDRHYERDYSRETHTVESGTPFYDDCKDKERESIDIQKFVERHRMVIYCKRVRRGTHH